VESRTSQPAHLDRVAAALVVAGLAVSIVAGVFLIERPAGHLPGIAQKGVLDADKAFERVGMELDELREAILDIEAAQEVI
jgi:hypothetical protein